MKKNVRTLIAMLFVACLLGLTACNKNETNEFGLFSVGGEKLTSFSNGSITLPTAKQLISEPIHMRTSAVTHTNTEGAETEIGQPILDFGHLIDNYSSLSIDVTIWNSDEKGELKKIDRNYELFGETLKNNLSKNRYSAEGTIEVPYLICNDILLDWFEQMNNEYRMSAESSLSEFSNIFSYHKSEQEMLVLQTHASSDLPQTFGGIDARFIQECEYKFDLAGKITNFQCSLGVKINNPDGTVQYNGSNIEVAFDWNLKK